MSCPQQRIGTRWFLRFPLAQTIQWFCYYISLSLTHPSQRSRALKGSSRSLPIGCSQCLHLQLHVFFNLHFSVQVFDSLTLRCEDWLEKTHCPCCGLMTVCIHKTTLRIQFLRETLWHFLSTGGNMHLELQRFPEHGTHSIPPARLWGAHKFSRWLLSAPETPLSKYLSTESKPDSCALPPQ